MFVHTDDGVGCHYHSDARAGVVRVRIAFLSLMMLNVFDDKDDADDDNDDLKRKHIAHSVMMDVMKCGMYGPTTVEYEVGCGNHLVAGVLCLIGFG